MTLNEAVGGVQLCHYSVETSIDVEIGVVLVNYLCNTNIVLMIVALPIAIW